MAEPSAMSAKATLRRDAQARRDALDTAARATASAEICFRAIELISLERPRSLSAYMAIRSEVDPSPILAWAEATGIVAALPAVTAAGVVFRRHVSEVPHVATGFGTRGPGEAAALVDPELIVLPLLAFDRAGTRLGYGRGHYDRAIAALHARGKRPTLLGIAFAEQEVAAIPAEPHDVGLDWVVTERETLALRRG
jgi:5-formyltetrahydrofolate cyclo-ligase